MSDTPAVDVRALWTFVTAQVKQEIVMPALWRALEAAHPIAIENGELVVGFSGEGAQHVGQLLSNQNRIKIEQVLIKATRLQLRIRVIDGTSLADWEAAKQTDLEGVRMHAEAIRAHQVAVAAGQTWEVVGEQIVRKFGNTSNRVLAGVQGRFLAETVEIIAEAYGRIMPEAPAEPDERAYGRTLERVAERTGVPASLIALLVIQRRERS